MELSKNQVRRKKSDSLLAFTNISRIEAAMQVRLSRYYQKFNLTLPQFEIIGLLWVNPEGLSQKEITERLQWTKGNTSGVLVRLVEKEFVSREILQEDKRVHRVILTHKGRNLADKIVPLIENEISNKLDSMLSVRERRMLKEILIKTFENI